MPEESKGLDLSSPSVQFDTNTGQWVDMSKPVQGGGYIQKTPLVTDVQFLPDYDEKKYEELGVAGTYTPETAENIPETQMVDIAGGKQIPLKQWVAASPMERLMLRGDISPMQGLGAGSPKSAIESSPLMQKMVNAGLETLDTGEKVYKYDYSRLPENERQVMKSQGLEGWKNTFTVETGYIDPYTNQPERVRRELWDTLDETDKQRIRESGYEAVIGGGELFPADFKASNVLLDTGEWVSKSFWDNPSGLTEEEIANLTEDERIEYESKSNELRQLLKTQGIESFNKWAEENYANKVEEYNQDIKQYIMSVGGNVAYYDSLSEVNKPIYLQQLQNTQDMDVKNYIHLSGGSIAHFESLGSDVEKQGYINEVSENRIISDYIIPSANGNQERIDSDTSYLKSNGVDAFTNNIFLPRNIEINGQYYEKDWYNSLTPAMQDELRTNGTLDISGLPYWEKADKLKSWGLVSPIAIVTGEDKEGNPTFSMPSGYMEWEQAMALATLDPNAESQSTISDPISFKSNWQDIYPQLVSIAWDKRGELPQELKLWWENNLTDDTSKKIYAVNDEIELKNKLQQWWGNLGLSDRANFVGTYRYSADSLPLALNRLTESIQSWASPAGSSPLAYEDVATLRLNYNRYGNISYQDLVAHMGSVENTIDRLNTGFVNTGSNLRATPSNVESLWNTLDGEHRAVVMAAENVDMGDRLAKQYQTGLQISMQWMSDQSAKLAKAADIASSNNAFLNTLAHIGAGLGEGLIGIGQIAFGTGAALASLPFTGVSKSIVPLKLGLATAAEIPVGVASWATSIPENISKDPLRGTAELFGMMMTPVALKTAGGIALSTMTLLDPRTYLSSSLKSMDINIDRIYSAPWLTEEQLAEAVRNGQTRARADGRSEVRIETKVDLPEEYQWAVVEKIGNKYRIRGDILNNDGILIEPIKPVGHYTSNGFDPVGYIRRTIRGIITAPDNSVLLVKDRAAPDYFELPGGGTGAAKKGGVQTVLDHLKTETKTELDIDLIDVKEKQPYLGMFHRHSTVGGYVGEAKVRSKYVDTMKNAHGGNPEVIEYVWFDGTQNIKVSPATYDMLKSTGLDLSKVEIAKIDPIVDKARDVGWADRVRADRMPTIDDAKAAGINIEPFTLHTIVNKTAAARLQPITLYHVTDRTYGFLDSVFGGKLKIEALTRAGIRASFFTSPEAALQFYYKSAAGKLPLKHDPSILAIQVLPEELASLGHELSLVEAKGKGVQGQLVWKIRGGQVENEVTFPDGTILNTVPTNVWSKIIDNGRFSNTTAVYEMKNPGPTKTVSTEGGTATIKHGQRIPILYFNTEGATLAGKSAPTLANMYAIKTLAVLQRIEDIVMGRFRVNRVTFDKSYGSAGSPFSVGQEPWMFKVSSFEGGVVPYGAAKYGGAGPLGAKVGVTGQSIGGKFAGVINGIRQRLNIAADTDRVRESINNDLNNNNGPSAADTIRHTADQEARWRNNRNQFLRENGIDVSDTLPDRILEDAADAANRGDITTAKRLIEEYYDNLGDRVQNDISSVSSESLNTKLESELTNRFDDIEVQGGSVEPSISETLKPLVPDDIGDINAVVKNEGTVKQFINDLAKDIKIDTSEQVVNKPQNMPFKTATSAFEVRNPVEAANEGRAGKVVYMSPEAYLKEAAKINKSSYEQFVNEVSQVTIDRYRNEIKSGNKPEMPSLNYIDKLQEGRHRALAAKAEGYTSIPVTIIDKPKAINGRISKIGALETVPIIKGAIRWDSISPRDIKTKLSSFANTIISPPKEVVRNYVTSIIGRSKWTGATPEWSKLVDWSAFTKDRDFKLVEQEKIIGVKPWDSLAIKKQKLIEAMNKYPDQAIKVTVDKSGKIDLIFGTHLFLAKDYGVLAKDIVVRDLRDGKITNLDSYIKDVTGETSNLGKNNVIWDSITTREYAEKYSKGEIKDSPEASQYYENNKARIEEELQNIYKEQQASTSIKSDVRDATQWARDEGFDVPEGWRVENFGQYEDGRWSLRVEEPRIKDSPYAPKVHSIEINKGESLMDAVEKSRIEQNKIGERNAQFREDVLSGKKEMKIESPLERAERLKREQQGKTPTESIKEEPKYRVSEERYDEPIEGDLYYVNPSKLATEGLEVASVSNIDTDLVKAQEADNIELKEANNEISKAIEEDNAEIDKYDEEIKASAVEPSIEGEYQSLEPSIESGYKVTEPSVESGYKSTEPTVEGEYKGIEPTIEGSYKGIEPSVEGGYKGTEPTIEGGYKGYEGYKPTGYSEYIPQEQYEPPPIGGWGIILGTGGKPLTKEQLEGAIGWKQGIMYKYIYPPYGQEDIINSRTPIQGIPIKEGIRSAYETIIRTRKGTIPPSITRHMGMMDLVITDADKNGQPEIHFIEREVRKGRGAVAKKITPQVFST